MAASDRIYVVHIKQANGDTFLVRADSPARAREHMVGVRVATQDDLVTMLGAGAQIEHATINEPAPAR